MFSSATEIPAEGPGFFPGLAWWSPGYGGGGGAPLRKNGTIASAKTGGLGWSHD